MNKQLVMVISFSRVNCKLLDSKSSDDMVRKDEPVGGWGGGTEKISESVLYVWTDHEICCWNRYI